MGIGPSVILDVSVDDFSSGWQQSVIWDFSWKGLTRQPSQSGRSEPTAELAQPALSSRRAYIPAALTPDRPSTQLVVTQYLFIHDNNFGMKSSVFGGGTVHDMRLKSEGLYIPRRRDACRMTISRHSPGRGYPRYRYP